MATAKTPMSTLHEYMLRKGYTVQYELITDSAGHDTFFQYIVTAGNVRETGSGRSKKEAKHNAALKALEVLASSDKLVRAQLLVTSGVAAAKAASILERKETPHVAVSPYAEQVSENYVGALAELCAVQNLREPKYELISESGPPHSKTFVMLCQVLTLKEQGTAHTKKQAKHISAKLMIDQIKEHLAMASPLVTDSKETKSEKVKFEEKNYQAAINGYCTIKDKDRSAPMGNNVSQTLSECHLTLRQLYGHQLTTLRAYASSHLPKETLEMFAQGHELPLSFTLLRPNKEGNLTCAASLGTTPELVKVGHGPHPQVAEEIAAINLLKALMTMIV